MDNRKSINVRLNEEELRRASIELGVEISTKAGLSEILKPQQVLRYLLKQYSVPDEFSDQDKAVIANIQKEDTRKRKKTEDKEKV